MGDLSWAAAEWLLETTAPRGKEGKWEASVTLSTVNKMKTTSSPVKSSLCRRENWGSERMNCRDWRWTLEPRGPHFSPLGRLGGSGPPAPPSSAHRAAEAAFPGPGRGIRSAAGVAPQDRSGLVRAQSSPLARRRGCGRRGAPRRQPEKGAGHPETRPSLFREGEPREPLPRSPAGRRHCSAWGGGGGDGGRQGLGRRPGAHSLLPGSGERGCFRSARRPRLPQGHGDHAH